MTLLEGIGLTRRYRLRDKTVEALTGVSLRLEEDTPPTRWAC